MDDHFPGKSHKFCHSRPRHLVKLISILPNDSTDCWFFWSQPNGNFCFLIAANRQTLTRSMIQDCKELHAILMTWHDFLQESPWITLMHHCQDRLAWELSLRLSIGHLRRAYLVTTILSTWPASNDHRQCVTNLSDCISDGYHVSDAHTSSNCHNGHSRPNMSASSRSEKQTGFLAEDQNTDPRFTAIVIRANVTR
jgi:hypothetical protein